MGETAWKFRPAFDTLPMTHNEIQEAIGMDPETLVECEACGGNWAIDLSVCQWCSRGSMTKQQCDRWNRRKNDEDDTEAQE